VAGKRTGCVKKVDRGGFWRWRNFLFALRGYSKDRKSTRFVKRKKNQGCSGDSENSPVSCSHKHKEEERAKEATSFPKEYLKRLVERYASYFKKIRPENVGSVGGGGLRDD